jgi:hypothetical protein
MMDEILKGFSEQELMAIQAGRLDGIPSDKLIALQTALAAMQPAPVAAPAPEVPTQRLRTAAQGATFGTADELEALVTAPFTGRTMEEQRQNIMGKVKAYQQDQPVASLGYEALGGIAPGLALSPLTGGTSLALTLPALARTAAVSGIEGGVTGFMSGEGDVFERASRVPQAALTAAVAGPAAQTVVKGATGLSTGAVDFARRKLGLRPAKAVEAEIQRLSTESGMTPDELVAAIGRGEVMAENKTLQEAVRGLYTMGGQASETIRSGLVGRPSMLRTAAMKQVQKGLAPEGRSNVLMQNRMDEDEIKAAERAMYQGAYQQGGIVTAPLLDAFSTAMRRSPKSSTDIGDYYRASTGKEPFFKVSADGNVEYGRTPTLEDMEIVRRGIKQEVDKSYRSGAGATGEALGDLEKQLRAQIDLSSPAVAGARTQAATVRTNREAFTEGRQALSKSADEVEVMFSRMNPGQIKAFRNGLMDALRARSATGSRFSMMRNLANEETKEGQILRMVYPGDMLEDTLASIQRSVQSKAATDRILGGSATASSLKQADRFGMGVSADDVRQSVSGDMFALYRTLRKVVNLNTPNLTEKQRDDIAKVLVSTNPDVVRRALTDESAMTALLNAIRTGGARLSSGAASSAAQISGNRYQQPSQQ